jgi:hypothetical protein
MAAAGFLGGLFGKSRRRIVLFLGAIIILGGILSLGTRFQPGGVAVYQRFLVHLPGFAQVRNIFRFAVFVQLAAALLAAMGLNLLVRAGNSLGIRPRWAILAVLACTSLSVAETWPRSQRFAEFPDVDRHEKWIDWLRTKTERNVLVATVPFSRGGAAEKYLITTQAMILGTAHQRQLVNGYSGYFPQSYLDLRNEAADFPNSSAIEALRDAGVSYVVDLRRSEFVPEDFEWGKVLPDGIELVYYDSNTDVAIYRIPPREEEAAD